MIPVNDGRKAAGKSREEEKERNIALLLEYDGFPFHGWQMQPGVATVQEILRTALRRVTGENLALKGSGRTDAGVHACGQVANFRTGSRLSPEAFVRAVNSLTPSSIAALDAVEVPSAFDAQYSAVGKTYRYILLRRSPPSPLADHRCWHLPGPLDLGRVESAGAVIRGKHDFSAFRSSGCASRNPVRTISRLEMVRRGDWISIDITADGFLRQMVRNIVGTLADAGRGRFTPSEIKAVLQSGDRTRAGVAAPPGGLYLLSVDYHPPLRWALSGSGGPVFAPGFFSLDNQP